MRLGPLEPLLADHMISDILVNGYDTIYIERKGKLERTNAQFINHAHLLNTIDRIVSAVGRRIDESSPMVDARLADGSCVNAIFPLAFCMFPVFFIVAIGPSVIRIMDWMAGTGQ